MPAASVGGRMTMVWHAVTASAASTTRAKGMFDGHRMVKILSISCRGARNALRRRIFEMQRLAGMDERVEGMRRPRHLGEGEHPVDRRIAAAGDDDALAAKILAAANKVEDALALIRREIGEGRAIGAKGADPGGDDHRPRVHPRARCRGEDEAAIGGAGNRLDRLAEMVERGERRRLLDQPVDQLGGADAWIAGNVVDRLFRVESRALPAMHVERVEHVAAHLEHAAFEDGEQPDRPGANDRDLRLVLRHALSTASELKTGDNMTGELGLGNYGG